MCVCGIWTPCDSLFFHLCLGTCIAYQSALKGEEPQPSKKTDPGKKRKNNKNNESRKRTNAPPDKEVNELKTQYAESWLKVKSLYLEESVMAMKSHM